MASDLREVAAPRHWRRLATIAFVALLFGPVVVDGDDLPLSRYPMYAAPRAPEITFVVAVGLDADGGEVALDTRTIADTGDPLIAESWLRAALVDGRLAETCVEIAGRVDDGDAVAVEIRREIHDVSERVRSAESLVEATVEASCPLT